MNYTIYNPTTGQILSTVSGTQEQLIPEGMATIPGEISAQDYYINNGQPIQKSSNPGNLWSRYEYDYATHTWIINPIISDFLSRQYRNQLLQDTIDRVNPVWYNSLTAEEQNQLVAYRQQLLDVPQQAGFPTQVEWPSKPVWL
jgi:hypothetical protein